METRKNPSEKYGFLGFLARCSQKVFLALWACSCFFKFDLPNSWTHGRHFRGCEVQNVNALLLSRVHCEHFLWCCLSCFDAESLQKLQVVGLQRCQSSLWNLYVSKRSISPGSVAECVVWGTCASLDFLEPWRLSRHLAVGFASYGVLIYFAQSRK